jgi:hypothetical protein
LNHIQQHSSLAFLNGPADVTIYLKQTEGFVDKQFPTKSYGLYGLKQAPRIWYFFLYDQIVGMDFIPLEVDSSIYRHPTKGIVFAVYIDDMLIFGPNEQACNSVYQELAKQFRVECLGRPKSFLRIKISRSYLPLMISLIQLGYINSILERFGMENANPAYTPLDRNLILRRRVDGDEEIPEEQWPKEQMRADIERYQAIIGSINHLAVYSRPDITFAASKLAQFNHDPSIIHYEAALLHVLRYLKAKNYSLTAEPKT